MTYIIILFELFFRSGSAKDSFEPKSIRSEDKKRDIPNVPLLLRPIVKKLQSKFNIGSLDFRLPNGYSGVLKGKYEGPNAKIILHSWAPLRKLLTGGGLGFSEAFLEKEWDSPNLSKFIEIISLNSIQDDHKGNLYTRLISLLRNFLRRNTRSGSKKNISAHYDLGNEFYSRWLDPSMTYSSAFFNGKNIDVKKAQENKYNHLLNIMKVKPGASILEIGCGWGGFAAFAGKKGFKVTGITISKEQYIYSKELIERENLNNKVKIELRDYRDVSSVYDNIVSIEMIEAVGEKYWSDYFNTVSRYLKPGGSFGLQAITMNDKQFNNYRKQADFIQTYIFPGGMLPSRKIIQDYSLKAGMKVILDKGFGLDYALTLSKWRNNFISSWPDIQSLGFDNHFKRLWDMYLSSCEGSFRSGRIDVRQIVIKN